MKPQVAPLVVRSVLREAFAQLRTAGVPSHTLAAELLLMHALGRDRTWIYAHPEEEISAADAERFFGLISRRAAGEPTQHLTGKQEFWGLEFKVTPDVLIPRPETEHVIEVALDRLAAREIRLGRPKKNEGAGLQIADIGTGSGCIAIALAKELPDATVVATDISNVALAIARRNAALHSVSERVNFVACNLLDKVSIVGAQHLSRLCRDAAPHLGKALRITTNVGESLVTESRPSIYNSPQDTPDSPFLFDLIVSNPPYVGRREAATLMREVREHEPEIALYGGEEGYEFYADLIAQAAIHLQPGGILVLELGHNSLPAVQPLMESPAWTNVHVTNDLSGIHRVLAAEKT